MLDSRRLAADDGRGPRVLMLSPRALHRELFRCSQIECEDVISAVEDVHMVAPRALPRGVGTLARKAHKLVGKLTGVELNFRPGYERVKLDRDYPLFVFYARDELDLRLLELIPGWRDHCERAVCICEELWWNDLENAASLRALRHFDLVATQFHNSLGPLREYTKSPPLYLPAGVDAIRFFPGLPPPRRTIDVFGMGRRLESMHAQLVEHAKEEGLTYLFDTIETARVRDGLRDHRMQLAEMIKRSRYFVVNRAKVDLPIHGGTQDEVGHRSFEGAAGGAVLIGHGPRGDAARELFDWPDAHIHLPRDSPAIVEVMRELDHDPKRVQQIRRRNVCNALRRHDWSYRWLRVLNALALPAMPRLARRLDTLEQLARDFEQQLGRLALPEVCLEPGSS